MKKFGRIIFFTATLILVFSSVSFAQNSADKSWNTFWVKFSTAVKTKNRTAIKSMASKRFTWHDADDTVSAWLQYLNQSKLWYLVQNSVNKGTMAYNSGEKKPWRVTKDNHLLFVFENGKWKFYGIMGD